MIEVNPPTVIPDPAITEPKTKMKPSEALKIGRMMYPQIINTWRKDDAFCALGLINYIRGDSESDLRVIHRETDYASVQYPCMCPPNSVYHVATIPTVILHLSDYHTYDLPNEKNARFRGLGKYLPTRKDIWTQDDIVKWLEGMGY